MTSATRITGSRPIAVIGAHGQIGYEIVRALSPVAPVRGFGSNELDISDVAGARDMLRALKPAVIVNAAGYTAVDQAETDRTRAMELNGAAPGRLAAIAADLDACFVHFSSDYVFDGETGHPYAESDHAEPVNYYGTTKLAGDRAVLDQGDAALILRTAWVYASRGRNFMLTMQRLARESKPLRVVDDQIGCPTPARFIAGATAAILGCCDYSPATVRQHRGVYHLAAAGETSWCGFARAIVRATPGCETTQVEAIPSAEFPTPARRPARTVLDCARAVGTFGLHVPMWDTLLALELEP